MNQSVPVRMVNLQKKEGFSAILKSDGNLAADLYEKTMPNGLGVS